MSEIGFRPFKHLKNNLSATAQQKAVRIKFYPHMVLYRTPIYSLLLARLESGSKAKMEGGSRDATTSSSTYHYQWLDYNSAKSRIVRIVL
jgi:hypothetical protein